MASTLVTQSQFVDRLLLHRAWVQRGTLGDKSENQLRFLDSRISEISLEREDLTGAQLVRCHFDSCIFKDCDFSYALLISSVFRSCRFLGGSWIKTDLRSADCAGDIFLECNMSRANLTDGNFQKADLTRSILDGAILIDTDLRFAVLDGTQFKGARILRAKFFGVSHLDPSSFEQAVIEDVDVSPEGGGARLSGIEALEFLKRE